MKKLLLITAILFYGITSAQEKGTWVFGGDLNFYTANNESFNPRGTSINNINKANGFAIAVRTGYVFTENNLEFGLGLRYNTSKSNDSYNDSEFKNNTHTISPYIRKYFPVNENFSFFLQGEVAFSSVNSESNNSLTENEGNSIFTGIRPGFVYFVTKNIALNSTIGALGYSYFTNERDGMKTSESNNFTFSLASSNIMFGIAYYL
jgi:hypothetical protein